MKTKPALLFVACVLAGAVTAQNAPKPTEPVKPTTQPTKPVNKFCAVEQEHEADAKVTYLYKGKLFAFCCEGCIDEFKKDPEKYKNAK
jgi:YHS domain-containing protein